MQGFEKLFPEHCLCRARVIDGTFADGCMRLSIIWASVIVEGAVQEAKGIRSLVDVIQLDQVITDQLIDRVGYRTRVGCVHIWTPRRVTALEDIPHQ